MDQMIWKIKLVVLWILQIVNFIAVLVIPYSFAIVSEEIGGGIGALIVFYLFLTCLMMWLTVILKPTISRWPVILVGVFYAFVKVQWIVQGLAGEYAFAFIFNEVWGLLAAALIIWYGWKIPQAESQA